MTEETNKTCDPFEIRCADSSRCISTLSRCDGNVDCLDNSDEKDCVSQEISASNYDEQPCDLHKCKNGQCILNEWVCDGIVHCDDNSDEMDCKTVVSVVSATNAVSVVIF